MESREEFTGSSDHSLIMKRKRTKRQRPSPTSTSSTGDDGSYFSIPSPTTSSGEMSITNTEQDQDMANCLILLARGVFQSHLKEQEQQQQQEEEGNNKVAKFNRHAGESGFYVYECKTCNRTFPSFQALGGHRASHKKPKTNLHENIAKAEQGEKTEQGIKFTKLVSLSRTSSDKPKKMHECSICGSEFSSGQALGGHMRRHRAVPATATSDTNAAESDGYGHDDDDKKRNVLPLDLNLPAPLELEDEINFRFDRSKQCLVFSGPALVECHH